jgi:hypothetical protein
MREEREERRERTEERRREEFTIFDFQIANRKSKI